MTPLEQIYTISRQLNEVIQTLTSLFSI